MRKTLVQSYSERPASRGPLVFALLASLILTAWLGFSGFRDGTEGPPEPATRPSNPLTATAWSALEPVLDVEATRLIIRQDDASQAFIVTVLRNETAGPVDEDLVSDLLSASIGFDASSGDVLIVREAAFVAARPAGETDLQRIGPFGLSLLISAGLLAMLLSRGAGRDRVLAPDTTGSQDEVDEIPPPKPRLRLVETEAQSRDLDPDVAVKVLRKWLGQADPK